MQAKQADHTALARSLSQRERRARALAQAEADAAERDGLLHTLVASGRLKVASGLTTPAEVARVTRD